MTKDIHAERILILDFGSQYTQLIARRVREIGVYSEIHPFDMTEEEIREFAPRGIILAGGPESVTELDSPRAPQCVFEMGIPVLGICYGMQTMASQLGGAVSSSDKREFGYARGPPGGQSQPPAGRDRGSYRQQRQSVSGCLDESRGQGRRTAGGLPRDRLQRVGPHRRHV